MMFSSHIVACENIRFSSLFADRDVSRGGTYIVPPPETSPSAESEEKRMFSQATHVDMICKNSAFQEIFVKLLFIEYRPLYEKVVSEYISTNSGIHHQFRIYYKGGKASQLLKGFV